MPKKILIVDDERDLLTMLQERLTHEGYVVIKAENGKEAINIAKLQHPDLILLDIIMPGMDGTEAANILQEDPDTKDIPIIFLTCIITKDEEKEGRVIGGRYFIAKPYEPLELLGAIKEVIK